MKAKSMVLAIKHGVFANIHKQTPLCLVLDVISAVVNLNFSSHLVDSQLIESRRCQRDKGSVSSWLSDLSGSGKCSLHLSALSLSFRHFRLRWYVVVSNRLAANPETNHTRIRSLPQNEDPPSPALQPHHSHLQPLGQSLISEGWTATATVPRA